MAVFDGNVSSNICGNDERYSYASTTLRQEGLLRSIFSHQGRTSEDSQRALNAVAEMSMIGLLQPHSPTTTTSHDTLQANIETIMAQLPKTPPANHSTSARVREDSKWTQLFLSNRESMEYAKQSVQLNPVRKQGSAHHFKVLRASLDSGFQAHSKRKKNVNCSNTTALHPTHPDILRFYREGCGTQGNKSINHR
jgi:hypothetical protein